MHMSKKVFISHNHCDRAFVHRLAKYLKMNGIDCWIDESEIGIGDSLIQKISNAIEELDSVIAIISLNSINSNWVKQELDWAMTKEIKGNQVVILPVLIDQCEIPFFLSNKFYADFTNPKKINVNAEKLLKSIIKKADNLRVSDSLEDNVQIGKSFNIIYTPTLIPFYVACLMVFFSLFGLMATHNYFEANTYLENSNYIKGNIFVFFLLVIALMLGEMIRVLLAIYQIRNDSNFANEAGLINISSIFFSKYRALIIKYWYKPLIKVVVFIEVVTIIGIAFLLNYAFEIAEAVL